MQDDRPVVFSSRSLSNSVYQYAQIEKEPIAEVYSLEKFHYYSRGKEVTVLTNYKPKVSISVPKTPEQLQTSTEKYH